MHQCDFAFAHFAVTNSSSVCCARCCCERGAVTPLLITSLLLVFLGGGLVDVSVKAVRKDHCARLAGHYGGKRRIVIGIDKAMVRSGSRLVQLMWGRR